MEDTEKQHAYKNVEFELTGDYQFMVPALAKCYVSYVEMTDAIDAAEKVLLASTRPKLNIPVVDAKGNIGQITGVHAGHGRVIVVPKSCCADRLYPLIPWILAAAQRRQTLTDELHRIVMALDQFKIPTVPGHRYTPQQHAKQVAVIAQSADVQLQLAAATNLETELARIPADWLKAIR